MLIELLLIGGLAGSVTGYRWHWRSKYPKHKHALVPALNRFTFKRRPFEAIEVESASFGPADVTGMMREACETMGLEWEFLVAPDTFGLPAGTVGPFRARWNLIAR